MTTEIDKALASLRSAIERAIGDARADGRREAAKEALARMSDALGIAQPKKRGRKPKARPE